MSLERQRVTLRLVRRAEPIRFSIALVVTRKPCSGAGSSSFKTVRVSSKPLVRYKSFLYQAASWKTARRVVAKVEFHFGELFPPRRLHRDHPGG